MSETAATPYDSTNAVTPDRTQLVAQLAELRKTLNAWQLYLQQQTDIANRAGRQVTWGIIGLIIGLMLVPIVIGLIIVVIAIVIVVTENGKRSQADSQRFSAQQQIATLQVQIIDLETKLQI